MTTLTKAHYRVPTASVYSDVRLDEFDASDIRAYLAHIDGDAAQKLEYEDPADGPQMPGVYIREEELGRIATLSLCGQRDAARELVLRIVGDKIGRAL